MKKILKTICFVICLFSMTLLATGCSSSSTYSLHNEDGTLNEEFVEDMNEYFEKHPDKLP